MSSRKSLAVLALWLLAATMALSTPAPTVINACYNRNNGDVRIVPSSSDCRHPEIAIFWNAQGPAGPQGPSGPPGATGATGASGPAGPQGAPGATGAPGPVGPAGTTGAAGPQGTPGSTGAAGPAGPPGATGATGPMGAPGTPGLPGPIGATGPMGAPGTPGLPGPIGATGPMGAPGTPGLPGPPGETGPMGAPGTPGPPGTSGEPGPAGPAGPTGPAGPAGVMDFADFYALMPPDNIAPVAAGSDVSFPHVGVAAVGTGIIGMPNNQFLLSDIGTYQVMFQVSVTEPGQLELTLNGLELPYTVVGRATGTSQIVGMALVQTTSVNSTLTVRNPFFNSPALTITPGAGGTRIVSANLIITRIQ